MPVPRLDAGRQRHTLDFARRDKLQMNALRDPRNLNTFHLEKSQH